MRVRSRGLTITRPAPPTDQNTPMPPAKNANFDNVLQRLHKLSIATSAEHRLPLSPCSLGAPFSLSPTRTFQDLDKNAANFSPRPAPAFDLSPQSSTSSGSEFSSISSSVPHDVFDAFVRTQSRVVRLFNLPPMADVFLSAVFHSQSGIVPATLWVLRVPAGELNVWAVFQTHREACSALSLSSPRMSVATALESDLEPFAKFKQFELPLNAVPPQLYMNPQSAQRVVRVSSLDPVLAANASFAGLRGTGGAMVSEEYTISSNPPNPRTSFRVGDWMCRSPQCAVHNYARNLTCIGCGCPRSGTANGSVAATNDPPQSPHHQHFNPSSSSRPQPSPRFASAPNGMYYSGSPSPTTYGFPPQSPPAYGRASQHGYASSSGQSVVNLPLPSPLASPTANKNMSAHPLLTPSGRAFASGGKVQNISSDPLSPCIMYWPDNEPFPEQGQIRPSSLMGVPQPPILNTGNRGPISHQIGDWICLRCAYLNWRRRKVCQTCFPYAEGNGDSISAAVQAERIALLTSVLAQTRLSSPGASPAPSHPQPHPIGRSHSTTPAQVHRPFVNFSPPPQVRAQVHRSQSHSELSSQFTQGYPIYQTAPHHTQQYQRPLHHPSPLQRHTVSANASPVDVYAPAPLLPSFLQDLVHSPTLSPSSTSSADLSEYEASPPSSTRSTFSLSGDDSVNVSPLQNIWRLDGEESKVLSAFPLPTRRELMGGGTSSRNNSPPRISSS